MDAVKRVRAARGSMNLSLTEFAKVIRIGRQTLVRIESGERTPKDEEYERMAKASGLPVEFFTTESLHDALAGADQEPTLSSRVAELERGLRELSETIAQSAIERIAQRSEATSEAPADPATRDRQARHRGGGGR